MKDLVEVDQDSDMRVFSTPIGAAPGKRQMVVGKSVPWKGVTGPAFKRQFPNIASNLDKAQTVGERHENVYGMAIVQWPDGTKEQMPRRAAEMAVDQHGDKWNVKIVDIVPTKKPWKSKGTALTQAGITSE